MQNDSFCTGLRRTNDSAFGLWYITSISPADVTSGRGERQLDAIPILTYGFRDFSFCLVSGNLGLVLSGFHGFGFYDLGVSGLREMIWGFYGVGFVSLKFQGFCVVGF